ncbi:MAG: aldo/keto reductase [Pseudomonadota bacterium]|nr:aldo/keto reductase [Pseudomonadota bacterium]
MWSPLAQGVLSGKYTPDQPPPAGTRATSDQMGELIKGFMKPKLLKAVQELRPLANEAGLTLSQFALAWVLREPNVASRITGASRPEQVHENAGASGRDVDPQLFAQAEALLAEARES